MTRWINRTKCAFLAIILFSSFFLNIFVSSISNAAANKITVNINIKVSDFNSSTTSKKYGPKYLVLRQIEQKSGGSEAQLSSGTNYKSAVIVAGSNKEVVSTSAIAQKTDKTVTLTGEFSNIAQYSGSTSAKYSVCLYTDKNLCSEEKTFNKASSSNDFYSVYNWNVNSSDGDSEFLKASYDKDNSIIDPNTVTAKISVSFSSKDAAQEATSSIPIILKTNTSTSALIRTTGSTTSNILNTIEAKILANDNSAIVNFSAVFENVSPITSKNYKVCLKSDDTICAKEELTNEEVFQKVAGQPLTVVMSLTEEQYNTAVKTTGTTTEQSSCAINGVGWIICPVVNFLAGIADGAFGFLADNFLSVSPQIFNTTDTQYNNTFKAWSMMRNIANILFVVAFLIIIYSQMTGYGMTNYGVKKLLPRLVVAAILVNLSFYICQAAIDISNILGYSFKNFFSSLITTGSTVDADWTKNGNSFTGIASAVLAVSGAWLALSAFIPVLLSAVVALIMILFILVGRQVAIILLIVVSPVAFVAFLLPNTDQWFKKWKKMFISMLILFPLIALVFGMSNLASAIIGSTLGAGLDDKSGASNSIKGETAQIMSAAVLLLPLFVVPSLLKKSLDSVGNIGATINKLGGSASKLANKSYGNSRLAQFGKYRDEERELRRSQIQSGTYTGRGGRFNPRNWRSGINKTINESRLSGEFGNRALTKGYSLADRQDDEILKNAASRIGNTKINGNPLTQAQMMQIATGNDVTDSSGNIIINKNKFDGYARRVAIERASKIATVADAHTLVEASTNMSAVERKTLVNSLAGSSVMNKAPYLGGKTLGDIEQGTANIDTAVIDNIANGRITAEVLAGTDKNSIKKIYEAASASGDPEIMQKLKTAADKIYAPGSRLGEKIVDGSEVANILNKIRGVDSNNSNNGSFTDGAGI